MLATDIWDYTVVGSCLAGSVVSNRLLALNSDAKILVIEAGTDAGNQLDILYAHSTNLIGGKFDWNYNSVPQGSLNQRKIQSAAGKTLGGVLVINTYNICLSLFLPFQNLEVIRSDYLPFSGWMRGSKVNFEEWAFLANNSRWGCEGLLHYFKRTEIFWNNSANPSRHGYDGPMRVEVPSTTVRTHPLRDAVFNSYEAVGIEALPGLDANAGNNLGFGDIAENRRNGKRQIASKYYPLNGITVLTKSLGGKVLLEDVAMHNESSSSDGNKVVATWSPPGQRN